MKKTTLAGVPVRPTRTVQSTSRVAEALRMLDEDAEALCVLDDEGRTVGTISPRDLRNLVISRTTQIEPYVNARAFPVSPDLDLDDVAGALADDPEILVIPVVATDTGQLVGIVRRADVLRAAGAKQVAAPVLTPSQRISAAAPATSDGYGYRNNTTVIKAPRTLARIRQARQEAS
jgi:CBS domain-containing protein